MGSRKDWLLTLRNTKYFHDPMETTCTLLVEWRLIAVSGCVILTGESVLLDDVPDAGFVLK